MDFLRADLHIHSCLSPCGDEDMTPNNIVNMAHIKGLNMIAVADHNTAGNLPAVKAVCDQLDMILVPAMELTTREEVHMLAYFKTVGAALAFAGEIYPYLKEIENNPSFFGAQQILDEGDNVLGEEKRLLLSALDIPLGELAHMVLSAGAVPVPAHINRGENGLLNVLGMLPMDVDFKALEVSRDLPCPIDTSPYKTLYSSDAHMLDKIFEADEAYIARVKSAEEFVDMLIVGKKMF